MKLTYKVMGYCLNRLDELVFMVVPKRLLTEFDIRHRLDNTTVSLLLEELEMLSQGSNYRQNIV